MSPMLQDFVSYIGQLEVYEKSVEILDKLVGVSLSAMQVNKVTDFYGESCGGEALLQPVLGEVKKQEKLYVEVDGSMLFTRDARWKEVKVGRVFKESDYVVSQRSNAGWIRHSQYIAHLGEHKDFTQKMDPLLDNYNVAASQLVIVSDGASWIQNWQQDAFADATFILDFYHAKSHLYNFTAVAFTDKKKGQQWAERQCKLLLESKVKIVIRNIPA